MAFELTSPAFQAGKPIPMRCTADRENVSPPLVWARTPARAQELALIFEDIEGSRSDPFVHWIVFGIPALTTALEEGVGRQAGQPKLKLGTNDFGRVGYDGPAPPRGHGAHRYRFTLYALDRKVSLPVGVTKPQLLDVIRDSILGTAELIGTYERLATPTLVPPKANVPTGKLLVPTKRKKKTVSRRHTPERARKRAPARKSGRAR